MILQTASPSHHLLDKFRVKLAIDAPSMIRATILQLHKWMWFCDRQCWQ